jgi:hypothetical protein
MGSYFGLLGAFAGAVAVPVRLIPQTIVHRPLTAAVAVALVLALAAVVVKLSAVPRDRRTNSAHPPFLNSHPQVGSRSWSLARRRGRSVDQPSVRDQRRARESSGKGVV